ncbi:MAG: Gfo/Idh/MocA family oxidoreductase [Bacillota bacterium]|nr:Gfo/Idh/MocA family oxidoreductase [Bacillota bacterium]
MINVGIIGCGKIAQVRHIPEYAENPNCKIVGLFDLNTDRAKELAETYGAKAYDSIEALLADENIHAVSICTSNATHASITIDALNAGKDVLCEKPMAITLEECEAMVEAAKKNRKKLMIGQNQRLAKAHEVAKEIVSSGKLGKVLTFRTAFGHGGPETWSVDPGKNTWFFDKKKAAMGAMADLGIHKTDLIQYLLGSKVVSVQAVLTTLDKKGADDKLISVDDNAICIYTMDNGSIGTMSASWTYYGQEDNSTILYGTNGILRLYDNPEHTVQWIHTDGTLENIEADAIQTNDNQTKSGIIDLFISCLIEDKEPEISGESVLSAMRAVFASIQSSESGQKVNIEKNRG